MRRALMETFAYLNRYRDAISDPLGQLERIYARVGLGLPPGPRRAMERWLAADARAKRPAHRYSADAFGLDEDSIRAAFPAYLERFVLPYERSPDR